MNTFRGLSPLHSAHLENFILHYYIHNTESRIYIANFIKLYSSKFLKNIENSQLTDKKTATIEKNPIWISGINHFFSFFASPDLFQNFIRLSYNYILLKVQKKTKAELSWNCECNEI